MVKKVVASFRDSLKQNKASDSQQGAPVAFDFSAFNAFIEKHRSRGDDFNLSELLQEMPTKDYEAFWKNALLRLGEVVQHGLYNAQPVNDEPNAALVFMDGLVQVVHEYIKNKKRKETPSLTDLVSTLAGTMFDCESEAELWFALQNQISKVCETWHEQKRAEHEGLLPLTITYLLIRALESTGKRADVVRLFKIRAGLEYFDLDDESSDTLKHLMLRCAIHPLFLRCLEGRRLLSFFFTLNVPFVQHLHLAIKNQIPACRKSLLDAYGEVYFRAWRTAEGAALLEVETGCVQDLLHRAVHANKPQTAKAVRRVLKAFHGAKNQRGVDEMLCRLHEPIIWRAMAVANPLVRRNAVPLFVDAFPINNPEAPKADTDKLLQKQFKVLLTLLSDEDVGVRTQGVHGVCKVLGQYWNLIPLNTTKKLLLKLVGDLTYDKRVSSVRAAVFKGLAFILDNHLSHALMQKLLPQLRLLIHDRAEAVQLAFVELLLVVKKIRAIKFFDVVPVDDLLLRLQAGSPKVAAGITELLLNSYFPRSKSPKEQLHRALALMRSHPHAAKVFFSHVHSFAAPARVCGLVAGLLKYLNTAAQKRDANNSSTAAAGEDNGDDVDDDGSDDDDALDMDGEQAVMKKKRRRQRKQGEQMLSDAQDTDLVEMVLCCAAQLWHSLPANDGSDAMVYDALPENALQSLLAAYDHSDIAKVALLSMASRLPAEDVPGLCDASVPHLASLPASAPVLEFGPLLECMFAWDKQEEVLVMVADSLEAALTALGAKPTTKATKKGGKKGGRKKAASSSGSKLSPTLALRYYSHLLGTESTRAWLLDQAMEARGGAAGRVEALLAEAMPLMRQLLSDDDIALDDANTALRTPASRALLLGSVEQALKLRLHLHALRAGVAKVAAEDAGQQAQYSTPEVPTELSEALEYVSGVVMPTLEVTCTPTVVDEAKPAKRQRKKRGGASKDDDDGAAADPFSTAQHLVLMLGKVGTELVTLGLATAAAPVSQLTEWAEALAVACETQSSGGKNGNAQAQALLALKESAFLGAMRPVFGKLLYQACVSSAQQNKAISAQDTARLARAVLRLQHSSNAPVVESTAVVKEALRACAAGSASLLQRVLAVAMEPVVGKRDADADPDADEDDSVVDDLADLDSMSLAVLGAVAKCPSAVFALPKAVAHFSSYAQVAMSPALAAKAASALCLLAERDVKAVPRRLQFLSSLQQWAELARPASQAAAAQRPVLGVKDANAMQADSDEPAAAAAAAVEKQPAGAAVWGSVQAQLREHVQALEA